MKKIVSLILSLVMALSLSVGMSTSAKADAESVTKDPVPAVVDNMSMEEFATLIKNTNGTIKIGDSDIPVSPDMCYLYGSKIGVQAVHPDTTKYPFNVSPTDYQLGTLVQINQGDIDVFDFNVITTTSGKLASGFFSVSELADQRCADGVAAKLFQGSKLFLVDGSYSLVVRYGDYHETINFTVSKLKGIRWPESLTKTQYFVGDTMDFTGDYLTLVYENGRTIQQPVTASMLHTIAGLYGSSTTEPNTEGLNKNCYKLGGVFSTNAAGISDVVIQYPVKTNTDIITNKTGANRLYLDSSFKAGFFISSIAQSSATLHDNGNVFNDDTLPTSSAYWRSSPYSLNGTKTYKITVLNANSYAPKLRYRAHVQNIGWQGWFYSPNEAGTDHQSLRMEAMQIEIVGRNAAMGNIEYMAHIQNDGDTKWITGDDVCGTEGKSYRMEGVAIQFTGKYKDIYSVTYRVHMQGIGWSAWYKDGQYAGTRGEQRRIEAIEIDVKAK